MQTTKSLKESKAGKRWKELHGVARILKQSEVAATCKPKAKKKP